MTAPLSEGKSRVPSAGFNLCVCHRKEQKARRFLPQPSSARRRQVWQNRAGGQGDRARPARAPPPHAHPSYPPWIAASWGWKALNHGHPEDSSHKAIHQGRAFPRPLLAKVSGKTSCRLAQEAGGTRRETQQTWKPFIVPGETRAEPTSEEGGIPALREQALPVSQPRGPGRRSHLPFHQMRRPAARAARPRCHLRAGDNLALEREGAALGSAGTALPAGAGSLRRPPRASRERGRSPDSTPAQAPPPGRLQGETLGDEPRGRRGGVSPRWLGSAGSRPALSKRWAKPFLLLMGRGPGQECQVQGDFSFVTKLKQPKPVSWDACPLSLEQGSNFNDTSTYTKEQLRLN